MSTSTRLRKANEFRDAVIAREDKAIRFLEQQWRVSLLRLNRDIDRMTRKIDAARLAGEKVNPDWLRRQAEFKRLQSNIVNEANVYSGKAADRLSKDCYWAANHGADKTQSMTGLRFTDPSNSIPALDQFGVSQPIRTLVSFDTLPTEEILSIAGRVTPRSPAGKILGKLGREAAKASRNVLVNGITRGDNVRVIGRELAKAANIPAWRAQRIARTEIFGAYTDASERQMRESKVVESWVWTCQLATACGACLAMHGQVFDVKQSMKKHPNCHCDCIPVPKSFSDLGLPPFLDDLYPDTFQPEEMQRQALSQIEGKSVAELSDRFGPGKGKLLASGEVKLDQLATVTKNKIWGGATVETPLGKLQ